MKLSLPPGQLHGKNLRTRQIGNIKLTDTFHPSGLKTPWHSHELSMFCFVREGTFSEIYGKKHRECRPLNLIYRPSGEVHADQFHNAGARCLTVEIGHEWIERVREYSVILDSSKDFYGGLAAWLAARLYGELKSLDTVSPLAIEGLTLELIAEASRCDVKAVERKPPRWLKQAKDFLHDRFSEPLSVTSIAKSVGIHPVHLARTFREVYGCTLGEYTRRLRIEFACGQLANSASSLTEITLASGFYDQSHFSRTFRQAVGMTPSEYRAVFRSS